MRGLAKKRTLVGVLLFIPLAVVLLVTFACLPAPVGDPETASVDDALTGAWKLVPKEGSTDAAIAIMRPWDKHTTFLQYLNMNMKDGIGAVNATNFKSWLTTIGGARFICCENLDNKDFLAAGMEQDRYFFVAKVEVKGDEATITPLNSDGALLKDVKTREKIEEVITANVENKDLYSESIKFKKIGKDELQVVDDMRKMAHMGDAGK